MTISARRRADAFDTWVSGVLRHPDGSSTTPGGTPTEFDELRPVLLSLRDHEPVDPRPEFVAELRTTLLERARTELAPTGPDRAPGRRPHPTTPSTPAVRRRTGRERWSAVAVASLALTGVCGVGAVAAQGSLPGETLYPIKRVIEDAQVGLQGGELDRGRALLTHAGDRLRELDELGAEGSTDVRLLTRTLDDFVAQADGAATALIAAYARDPRPQTIADLRTFAADSTDALARLRRSLPDGVSGAVDDATRAVARTDSLALATCRVCSALPALTQLDPAAADVTPSVTVPGATGGTGSTPPSERPVRAGTPGRGSAAGQPGGDGRTGRASSSGRGGDTPAGRGTGRPSAAPTEVVPDPGAGAPTAPPVTGKGGLVDDTLGSLGGALGGATGKGKGSGPGAQGSGQGGGAGGSGGSGQGGGGGVGGAVDGLVEGLEGATSGLGGALGG